MVPTTKTSVRVIMFKPLKVILLYKVVIEILFQQSWRMLQGLGFGVSVRTVEGADDADDEEEGAPPVPEVQLQVQHLRTRPDHLVNLNSAEDLVSLSHASCQHVPCF